MHKRRVLQIVQHLQPGGIETMALDLMRKASSDTDVHLLSLEGHKKECLHAWSRLQPYADRLHFMQKRSGLDFKTIMRMVKRIKTLDIDVVHTHHIGPLVYGGLAARIAGVDRLIHTEHDAWHLGNRKRRWLQTAVTKLTRPVVVADADLVAEAVKSAIPSITPAVIHNGVDTSKFFPGDKTKARTQFGLPLDVQLIGCAARLEEVKGHESLLSAMAALPDTIHLALAGDGGLRKILEHLSSILEISHRVHFLGSIDDMPAFHRALDVFCLSSKKEGLPLSPLEAQASGVPVVLTNVGGCSEAVCPETGYLVQPNSQKCLSEALLNALNSAADGNPRDFVLHNRNLEQTISAYEALH